MTQSADYARHFAPLDDDGCLEAGLQSSAIDFEVQLGESHAPVRGDEVPRIAETCLDSHLFLKNLREDTAEDHEAQARAAASGQKQSEDTALA